MLTPATSKHMSPRDHFFRVCVHTPSNNTVIDWEYWQFCTTHTPTITVLNNILYEMSYSIHMINTLLNSSFCQSCQAFLLFFSLQVCVIMFFVDDNVSSPFPSILLRVKGHPLEWLQYSLTLESLSHILWIIPSRLLSLLCNNLWKTVVWEAHNHNAPV